MPPNIKQISLSTKMSTNKRNKPKTLHLLKSLFSSPSFHFTCSAGCGGVVRPNRSPQNDLVYQPLPIRAKSSPYRYYDEDDVVSSPTFSLNLHSNDVMMTPSSQFSHTPKRTSTASSSKVGETVAVVKESDDPYLDFRHSMLQMIFEKEIFTLEALQELLACFLRLNLPCHHDDIIRAFSEIWGAVMSPAATHSLHHRRSPNFSVY